MRLTLKAVDEAELRLTKTIEMPEAKAESRANTTPIMNCPFSESELRSIKTNHLNHGEYEKNGYIFAEKTLYTQQPSQIIPYLFRGEC
jgi:hypothetical protein